MLGPSAPLSLHPGSVGVSSWLWLVTTLRHHFWTSCVLRNRILPPAVLLLSRLCGQTGPSWQPGLGSCRQGQLWTVASQEVCPSAHLNALTCLFSCDKASGLTRCPAVASRHGKGVARGLRKAAVSTLGIIYRHHPAAE